MLNRLMLKLAENKILSTLENVMGKNWKGKTAGIVLMLLGAAGVLHGFACMLDHLINSQDVLGCWPEVTKNAGTFAQGLGVFGIRQAIGPRADA